MNINHPNKAPASQPEILAPEKLWISYDPRQSPRGLSHSRKTGRAMDFLGRNGAGKITSIHILTTMLETESGYFVVDGTGSEYPEKIHRKIRALSENLGFPQQMTGIEDLIYFGKLFGRSEKDIRAHSQSLLEEVACSEGPIP